MKKITFYRMSAIFLGLSLIPLTALANLIKTTNNYGVQGVVYLDQSWVNQINQEMQKTPGSYVQWVEVQLRDVYSGKYVQTVYHQDYSSNQTTFPSQEIIIPPTAAPFADSYYKVTYMYQIYGIGRDGATSKQNFLATTPYQNIKVIYPTNF